jgi:hypothetical protein
VQRYRWEFNFICCRTTSLIDRYHQAVKAGIFDDQPVELLNGDLIEMPSEGLAHAGLSRNAGDYLRKLLGDRAKVREGHPVALSDHSEPQVGVMGYIHLDPKPIGCETVQECNQRLVALPPSYLNQPIAPQSLLRL